jgi:hypothetical protein
MRVMTEDEEFVEVPGPTRAQLGEISVDCCANWTKSGGCPGGANLTY